MEYTTKQRIADLTINLKSFLYNLMYFTKRSQEENDVATLRNLVLSLPREVKELYAEECAYVESLSPDELRLITFPYPETKGKLGADVLNGKEHGLFYAVHAGKKKLFFPSLENNYDSLVNKEGLLGTGSLAKSPHCYQDKDFKVDEGDVILDVGCAEAIFALDNIEKVSKAYLFECAPEWRKSLKLTFAPYKDKVVIVNKLVSDKTTRKSTTLIDVVKPEMDKGAHFFVNVMSRSKCKILLRLVLENTGRD